MAARLQWVGPDGKQQNASLARRETLIGRKGDADVVVGNRYVSRHHAKIIKTQAGCLLFDLTSLHGTFVGGQRIEYHWLRNHDTIQLGKDRVEIEFLNKRTKTPKWRRSGKMAPSKPSRKNSFPRVLSTLYRTEMLKNMGARRELERELLFAQQIQSALIPQTLPEIEYLRICGFSKPTLYVGGDFYDFYQLNSGEIAGVLADVAGKGAAASLLSSFLLGSLQMLLRTGTTLVDAVTLLNNVLCEKPSGKFATLFLFCLTSDGHGRFVSAGHNPAYLRRAASTRVEELSSNNTIAGAFNSVRYLDSPFVLQNRHVLVIYSDGVTEAENPEGEMFGEDRLKRLILAEGHAGGPFLKEKLESELESFTKGHPQTDDITFLIVERT